VGKTKRSYPAGRVVAVHPHVRGENETVVSCWQGRCGSPPRAWGKRVDNDNPRNIVRFTPTCVGKTKVSTVAEVIQLGSPPRAWGKRSQTWSELYDRRLTPTCVGKTPGFRRSRRAGTVHPHVRGENTMPL